MGGSLSAENVQLAERLKELLRDAWPSCMTSTQLAEQCGLRRTVWTWCDGDRCRVSRPNTYTHNVRHCPPTDYRYGLTPDGRRIGWDEYEVDVSIQQVNPALNRLHRLGLAIKNPPQPGSRSVLWEAVDLTVSAEDEAEVLEILRQTVERLDRAPEPEPEPLQTTVWKLSAPATPPVPAPVQDTLIELEVVYF